ncbi:MAG: hypothetical protein EP343_29545 [Deltaproteobacteria bacterium]|nr:MAG: hypothetical protein EP343_29545 [Deltaproteobacteria bacterium]
MKRIRSVLSVLVVPVLVLWGCTPTNPGTTENTNPTTNPPTTRKEPEPTKKPPEQRVDPPTQPTKPRVEPPPAVRDHWSNTKPSDSGSGVLNPSFGRYSRRMSVSQLKDTIPRLFNGITWKSGNTNMFDSLSRTLGQADYLQVTFTSRDSTSLFMKFMDDMAGQVCKAAVVKDLQTQNMATRSVIRYNDIDKTLRFLRLKFHSIYVPESSTESIKQLRTLYDRILAKTRKESTAWEGVCIAVLTSPEFFAY